MYKRPNGQSFFEGEGEGEGEDEGDGEGEGATKSRPVGVSLSEGATKSRREAVLENYKCLYLNYIYKL
jgi:hypothetical protein